MLDFIGIGARRAGDDWLFAQLRRHPEIHFPRELELGFWSQHYPRSLAEPDYARDLNWYRSVFGHWDEGGNPALKRAERPAIAAYTHHRNWFDKVMTALDRVGDTAGARMASLDEQPAEAEVVVQSAAKLGDFSPSYCLFDDAATVEAVHAFAPQARVLYVIRDPRARAWAAAEKLRALAGLSPDEVSDAWYLDHFRSQPSLRQGDYAAALSQWLPLYGDALLVLRFEDIAADPHAALRTACEHLGVVDTAYFDAEPAAALLKHWPESTPIRASLQPALDALYAPKLEALRALTPKNYPPVD